MEKKLRRNIKSRGSYTALFFSGVIVPCILLLFSCFTCGGAFLVSNIPKGWSPSRYSLTERHNKPPSRSRMLLINTCSQSQENNYHLWRKSSPMSFQHKRSLIQTVSASKEGKDNTQEGAAKKQDNNSRNSNDTVEAKGKNTPKELGVNSNSKKKGGGEGKNKGKGKSGGGNKLIEKIFETYEAVIGIEVHCQLLSDTKAYCGCSTKYNPSIPNVNICPICTGEPGTLPVPNVKVIELATKAALALNLEIAPVIYYDRKNYYYPDTPKNYQITQYKDPLGCNGYIELPDGKRIGVTRLHMEEDSAKMIHQGSDNLAGSSHSLVDFNRAGIPLAEIVSEPDMSNSSEAAEYGRELQKILRYIGASDGAMAEGSLRLDINISIRKIGEDRLRNKVEVKNVNSFKAVSQAVDYEIIRQYEAYESQELIRQETRMWDEKEGKTKLMRVKEGESDYRYFPEPDIPPLELKEETVNLWQSELIELPSQKRERYQSSFGLDLNTAKILTDDIDIAKYFEQVLVVQNNIVTNTIPPIEAAKWITGDIAGYMNNNSKGNAKITIDMIQMRPKDLAELIYLIQSNKLSGRVAKDLLPELLAPAGKGGRENDQTTIDLTKTNISTIIQERNLEMINDEQIISDMVGKVIDSNQDKVQQYINGKTKLLGFFLGAVIKESNGRAEPNKVNEVTVGMLNRLADENQAMATK